MSKNFLDFRPAHFVKGINCNYVAYSVINPETGNFVVKRIKLNYIKNKSQLKQYAEQLTTQINLKLAHGFNPFLCESSDKLVLLDDAILDFLKSKKRDLEQKIICAATFQDYKQQLNYFSDFISNCFIFKIKRADINNFLDDIYINKNLTAVTRNHYLQTVRSFFSWCVNKGYIAENPAKEIGNLKQGIKKRSAIPASVLQMIFDYFINNNQKNYLLACYLIYSCFIRPSELCKLKIKDISFKNQTIFISKDISKNKKNQIVTVPENVLKLMLDCQIYNYPSEFYLIGKYFTPSEFKCTDKILRAEWLKMRKKLRLSDTYMLYSLKDTGITQMINLLNVAEVRDQARHSSISITDVYTDRTKTDGNDHIKKLNFKPNL